MIIIKINNPGRMDAFDKYVKPNTIPVNKPREFDGLKTNSLIST